MDHTLLAFAFENFYKRNEHRRIVHQFPVASNPASSSHPQSAISLQPPAAVARIRVRVRETRVHCVGRS